MIKPKSGREIEANLKICFGLYVFFCCRRIPTLLPYFVSYFHFEVLKGVLSRGFCCFCQSCADVISTQYLTPYTKCLCRVIKKISKKIYHGSLSNFFGDYCRHYIQTLKSWLNFFNFFNFHMAFATDDRNRFQCLNIYSFT